MDFATIGKKILAGLSTPFTFVGGLVTSIIPGAGQASQDLFKMTSDNLNFVFTSPYKNIVELNQGEGGERGTATIGIFDTDRSQKDTLFEAVPDLFSRYKPRPPADYKNMSNKTVNIYDDVIKDIKAGTLSSNKKL